MSSTGKGAPAAEEFIVGWAKELPRDVPLALLVDLDRQAGLPDEAAVLRDAIHEFFRQRAEAYRRRLRELLRRGRTSLMIGLTVLAAAIALGDFLATLLKTSHVGEILRESLTIGGWVSMSRPLEIFLYDWWPIRSEAQLSDRLAAMPVRIRYMRLFATDLGERILERYPALHQFSDAVSARLAMLRAPFPAHIAVFRWPVATDEKVISAFTQSLILLGMSSPHCLKSVKTFDLVLLVHGCTLSHLALKPELESGFASGLG